MLSRQGMAHSSTACLTGGDACLANGYGFACRTLPHSCCEQLCRSNGWQVSMMYKPQAQGTTTSLPIATMCNKRASESDCGEYVPVVGPTPCLAANSRA